MTEAQRNAQRKKRNLKCLVFIKSERISHKSNSHNAISGKSGSRFIDRPPRLPARAGRSAARTEIVFSSGGEDENVQN